MRRFTRLAGLVALVVFVGVVILALVFNLHTVQMGIWGQVAEAVRAASGWTLAAESFELDLAPGRVAVSGLTADGGAGQVARVERLEASWSWRDLLATPHRLASVTAAGVTVDPSRLPPPTAAAETEPPVDLAGQLAAFEVGRLEVSGVEVAGTAPDLTWAVNGLGLEAALQGARYRVGLRADGIVLGRQGRDLALGPLVLDLDGDAAAVQVRTLTCGGDGLEVALSGSLGVVGGGLEAALDTVAVTPDTLLAWYDPELRSLLAAQGTLRLQGRVERSAAGQVSYRATHVGGPLVLAGAAIDALELDGVDGVASLTVSGAEWGRLDVATAAGPLVDLALTLERTTLVTLGGLAGVPPLPPGVPADLDLSGTVTARSALPFDLDRLELAADLAGRWSDGRATLAAHGSGGAVTVDRLSAVLPGAELAASGRVSRDRLDLELELVAEDPATAVAAVARRLPAAASVPVGGGPLRLTAVVGGSLAAPTVAADLAWQRPQAMGRTVERLDLHGEGDLKAARWTAAADLGAAGRLTAAGRTDLATLRSEGHYDLAGAHLEGLLALAEVTVAEPVSGQLAASGDFAASPSTWRTASRVELVAPAVGAWQLDRVEVALAADPTEVVVDRLEASRAGAVLRGHGRLGLGAEQEVSARLALDGLELWTLPLELPTHLAGTVAGDLELAGTVAEPEALLELSWRALDAAGPLRAVAVAVSLREGVVALVSKELRTAAGDLALTASLPLGELVARPAWLWPGAPTGAMALDVVGEALATAPLSAALGAADAPALTADSLIGRVRWVPGDPGRQLAELELDGVEIEAEGQRLAAEGVVRLGLRAGRVVVDPVAVVGADSRLELGGAYDLATGEVTAHVAGSLDPTIARYLPVPLEVDGAIAVEADLAGVPAALVGTVRLDHSGGTMLMRDPLVELRDLVLDLRVDGGVVRIEDGSAGLNRGRLTIGGGWDPASGQGVVLELDGVAFLLPMGILSRWDGVLAVEPQPEALARVVGDLTLDGGFWDQPFSYADLLLGDEAAALAADDPLHGIELDLEVDGHRGLTVDNNLGAFQVVWKNLHIGGSGALPAMAGELTIPQGGRVILAGQVVTVRRGSVEFSGDPFAPPRVEIVPEGAVASFGSDSEGGGVDTTAVATEALAKSLGSALGLENDTLAPAEIAAETETDPGQRFAVGQRLSRTLALFLTTNLSDVQDRQTMLQLWNLPGLPGLAFQVFDETADDVLGAAVIERVAWGGSRDDEARPLIHKVKLEGDWPLWKWRLKRATGLAKGRPFDPFLLFAGEIRLQQALAEAGWHDARVTSRREGRAELPTLVFAVEPGERVPVTFAGDSLPRALRRRVASLYRPPPLDQAATAAMRTTIAQHLAGEGFPDAGIEVAAGDDGVVVTVARGAERHLTGPVVHGVAPEVAAVVAQILGAPSELAAMVADPERALVAVRSHLRTHGYQRVEAVAVRLEAGGDATEVVHLDVTAGPRGVIDEVRVDGADPLAALVDLGAPFAPGQPLDRWRINQALIDIRALYRAAGYVDAAVAATVNEVGDERWEVVLSLEPGSERQVGVVEIAGLRHLEESVLGGGLLVEEGEVLSLAEVDDSAGRLAAFAPVERVDVATRPAGPERTDVTFTVTERDRWQVGAGVRYRSDRGAEVVADVADRNLFGRGYDVNFRTRWDQDSLWGRLLLARSIRPGGRNSWVASISYDEHGLVGTDGTELAGYREEVSKISFEHSLLIGDRMTVGPYLQVRRTHTYEEDPFFPEFALDETIDIAKVGGLFVRDRLDNPFDPRRGTYAAVDLSWGQEISGSEKKNIRSLLTGSLVLEPRAGWTWMQSLRLGLSDPLGGSLVSDDRFYAGGQSSIRGFEQDLVGPVEELGGTLYPAGGGALFVLNEELRIPIWQDLRLAVFTDVGQVWDSWAEADGNLAVGVGLGFRYSTPIGPVWGDVAWPVANRGVSSGIQYAIGIGRSF